MPKSKSAILLDQKRALLQIKKQNDLVILKNQLNTTLDDLKPVNLLKNTFSNFKNDADLKNSLLQTSLGIMGGYLSKKWLFGSSGGVFKKIAGSITQFVVTNYITKKAEEINT